MSESHIYWDNMFQFLCILENSALVEYRQMLQLPSCSLAVYLVCTIDDEETVINISQIM